MAPRCSLTAAEVADSGGRSTPWPSGPTRTAPHVPVPRPCRCAFTIHNLNYGADLIGQARACGAGRRRGVGRARGALRSMHNQGASSSRSPILARPAATGVQAARPLHSYLLAPACRPWRPARWPPRCRRRTRRRSAGTPPSRRTTVSARPLPPGELHWAARCESMLAWRAGATARWPRPPAEGAAMPHWVPCFVQRPGQASPSPLSDFCHSARTAWLTGRLRRAFRLLAGKFWGIRNGIDPDIWDPAGGRARGAGSASSGPRTACRPRASSTTHDRPAGRKQDAECAGLRTPQRPCYPSESAEDPLLPRGYTADSVVEGKAAAKAELRKRMQLSGAGASACGGRGPGAHARVWGLSPPSALLVLGRLVALTFAHILWLPAAANSPLPIC